MRRRPPPSPPTRREFLRRIRAFRQREQRDAMYTVASRLLALEWGHPERMAQALGVVLLTWNQAFYRYGSPDFGAIKRWIARHLPILRRFRSRRLATLSAADSSTVRRLFDSL